MQLTDASLHLATLFSSQKPLAKKDSRVTGVSSVTEIPAAGLLKKGAIRTSAVQSGVQLDRYTR